MSMVTLDELLISQKIYTPNTRIRERYQLILDQVTAAVKVYLKWDPEGEDDYIEYYDGNNYRDIVLRKPYVKTLNHVWFDQTGYYGDGPDAFASNTLLTAGQNYSLVRDEGTKGKSGLLRALWNWYPWFPGDLIYARQPGGLAYQAPARWLVGYGNIKVDYNYGLDPIPEDLKLAIETAVGVCASSVKVGYPLSSESLGAHSISLHISKEPEFGTVKQILGRYRDQAI